MDIASAIRGKEAELAQLSSMRAFSLEASTVEKVKRRSSESVVQEVITCRSAARVHVALPFQSYDFVTFILGNSLTTECSGSDYVLRDNERVFAGQEPTRGAGALCEAQRGFPIQFSSVFIRCRLESSFVLSP